MRLRVARRGTAAPTAKAKVQTKRRGGGVLMVLVVFLGLAGIIRLGQGAVALALDALPSTASEPGSCPAPADPPQLLAAIRDREAELTRRELALADREQALAVIQGQVEVRIAALTAAEERLSQTVAIADQAADADVTRLTAMYENMKPKEAAPLFQEMAPEFAAGFLGKMRPDAAGAILSSLDPKSAYAISVILAGRNASAPQN